LKSSRNKKEEREKPKKVNYKEDPKSTRNYSKPAFVNIPKYMSITIGEGEITQILTYLYD
jgi:hypothetical protein